MKNASFRHLDFKNLLGITIIYLKFKDLFQIRKSPKSEECIRNFKNPYSKKKNILNNSYYNPAKRRLFVKVFEVQTGLVEFSLVTSFSRLKHIFNA